MPLSFRENIEYASQEADVLNSEILPSEISSAIKKLSNGKSSGIDGIPSEFYKNTLHDIVPVLHKLFNTVFSTGNFPSIWSQSVICPIFKSGSKKNPANYRGISITTSMYKIFSCIINKRLYEWAEATHKIDEAQAGFRQNYSTIDNLFTLQAIIQKYLSKQGRRFYCLYVDFSRAFDKVNHSSLFECLKRLGIHGNFLRTLIGMYSNILSCVKADTGLTELFRCNVGTRQGDCTSTTIFSLFINQLCSRLREGCRNGIFINENMQDIVCLMFADDIANCSDTVINLQNQLNIINQFCSDTGMEINLSKTEVIVFRNGGPLRANEKWFLGKERIKTSSCYKYMGLYFTPTLSWSSAQEKLASQGKKAILSIYNFQRSFGYFAHKDLFKLFDSIVKPILCYGAQIWGHTYSNVLESVQFEFCKRYLKVNSTTNNMVVLGECGRYPLFIDYYFYCIRYWCKLLVMSNSRYPRNCYLMLKSLDDVGRRNWVTHIKNMLFLHGFGHVWVSQELGDVNYFLRIFKQRTVDCFKQNWHAAINESSRCFHYKHFKSLLNPEKYLTVDLPYRNRIALARFRCFNHKFRIKTGRHSNIPREDRICIYCLDKFNIRVVECEFHVFFHCPKHDVIRQHYLFNWYKRGTDVNSFYEIFQIDNFELLGKLAFYVHMILKSD